MGPSEDIWKCKIKSTIVVDFNNLVHPIPSTLKSRIFTDSTDITEGFKKEIENIKSELEKQRSELDNQKSDLDKQKLLLEKISCHMTSKGMDPSSGIFTAHEGGVYQISFTGLFHAENGHGVTADVVKKHANGDITHLGRSTADIDENSFISGV